MTRSTVRVALRVAVATLLTVSGALVALPLAHADTTSQTLPFMQNWTNTAFITADDNWSGVSGITGYRGDGLTGSTGTDPQTVLADGAATPVDVNANRSDPNTFTTGGLAEFDGIANPAVGLNGSGTADDPHMVIFLNTTGESGVNVSYNLRDLDGSADNAVSPVALQYRVGNTGNYTNIPAGFVADASSGPSSATLVTPVSATLPAAADNQPLVNVRIISSDAVGSDEWIGIDDINISTADAAPSVSSTTPTNGASNVAISASIDVTFSESVNVAGSWFTISGSTSGPHTATVTGGPTTFTLNPDSDFANSETVSVNIVAAQVTDQDATPDNMAADYPFSFGTAAADAAPTVSSTVPNNGAGQQPVNANITVNFSESVHLGALWLTVNGSVSGNHSYAYQVTPPCACLEGSSWIADPLTDFVAGETVTVRVVANQIGDTDATDPPDNMAADYVFSFGTPLRIHDIQGVTHISPYAGQAVAGIPGIITAIRSNGFYLQDPTPDANDATSEGIFVFTSSAPSGVVIGDSVSVSGTVSEFRAGGASSPALTNTEITGPTVIVNSSGNPLPTATVVGNGGRIPPASHIDDDATGDVETSGAFDWANDGIDFWESLEFMRVQLNNARVVGPTSDFGSNREVPVVGDNGANATILTARGGILLRQNDNNPERIILNDVITGGPTLATTVDVGDSYPGATLGVIDYAFNNFKLEITSIPALVSGGLTGEVTTAPTATQLSVGSFNVENLDPNDGAQKFTDLANELVNNMLSPDIVALEEVQDNNGATNDSVVDASTTINTLIAAIDAADPGPGPVYQFRQINPVDDQDGGEPGGNIRVAFLYRTDRGVAFVDRPGGGSTVADSVVDNGGVPELAQSPGRIAPTNAAWNASRKPLAGEFTYNGKTIFVIANHFNSKGGDQPLWGHFQPPVLSSEAQRIQQADLVHDFTQDILTIDPNANVVVLGDLNDFTWSNPLATLTAGGILEDLVLTLPEPERYSYVFEGNTQELDHLLGSPNMEANLDLYDPIHVNAEFAPQVSDHDPLVALFSFVTPLTCATSGGGPGPQTINGTPGDDVICGRAGDDTIHGNGGNDVINGGAGNDTITGDGGNDRLLGKKGLDDINGGTGPDELKGGYGNDTLNVVDGTVGNDSIDGGKGTDTCTGDPGDAIEKCP